MNNEQYLEMLRNGSEAIKRLNKPKDQRLPYSKLQEQQNDDERKDHHKPKKAKDNGAGHPSYRISVVFLQADKRRRDIDNQLSTVLDCLRDAIRRFSAMDTGDQNNIKAGKQGI